MRKSFLTCSPQHRRPKKRIQINVVIIQPVEKSGKEPDLWDCRLLRRRDGLGIFDAAVIFSIQEFLIRADGIRV